MKWNIFSVKNYLQNAQVTFFASSDSARKKFRYPEKVCLFKVYRAENSDEVADFRELPVVLGEVAHHQSHKSIRGKLMMWTKSTNFLVA